MMRGSGSKFCKICKKNNHNTNECTKRNGGDGHGNRHGNNNDNASRGLNRHGNPRSNSHQGDNSGRVNKKKHKGHSDGSNKGGRSNNNNNHRNGNDHSNPRPHKEPEPDYCLTCGLRSHASKDCRSAPLPDPLDHCPCGNDYHQAYQCPWREDVLTREAAQRTFGGKLCQWCKTGGDGRHDYRSCLEPRRFRNGLVNGIHHAYDSLAWCWHCSSPDHLTRACQAAVAEQGRRRWDARIAEEIEAWVRRDASAWKRVLRDEEEDVIMGLRDPERRPPVAADYKWCVLCERFGHWADEKAGCNFAEYDRRCPVQFQGREGARKPFVPDHYRTEGFPGWNVGGRGGGGGGGGFGGGINGGGIEFGGVQTFEVNCEARDCEAKIRWPIVPSKKSEMLQQCVKCWTMNTHPLSALRQETDPSVKIAEVFFKNTAELFAGLRDSNNNNNHPKKGKRTMLLEREPDEYKKRPSLGISNKSARSIEWWPNTQPRYEDVDAKLGKRHVFNHAPFHPRNVPPGRFHNYNGEAYFNCLGNFQEYFPAFKFAIKKQWQDDADNPELPINRAGKGGLYAGCLRCGTRILVADDEGDVVMCDTDPMCTVGCGRGRVRNDDFEMFFLNEYGNIMNRCRCLTIIGQRPQLGWIVPLSR